MEKYLINSNKLVTIIIPIYNSGLYLSECLDSLLEQTYRNIEIVCVDDGSTDNSRKILEYYLKKDNRIKVFYRDHQGVSATRNYAIEQATGDYITFVDSDDKCNCNLIETSVMLAEKNNADIIINNLNLGLNLQNKAISNFSFLVTVQLFVSKKLLNKYSDIRYSQILIQDEDALFAHKLLALSNKTCKNNRSRYFYRRHSKQSSKKNLKNSSKMLENLKLEMKDLISFYNKYNL